MPCFIDPTIEAQVGANERATIETLGLEVRQNFGHFDVVDPVVRKAERGKGGKYTAPDLAVALKAAVSSREVYEKNANAPSDKPVTDQVIKTTVANSRKAGDLPSKTKVSGKGNVPEMDPTLTTPLVGNMPSEGQPAPIAAATKTTSKAPKEREEISSEPAAKPTTRKSSKRVQNGEETTLATTKRATKKRDPKERKLNRYIRASRLIAEDSTMLSLTLPHNAKTWLPLQQKLAPKAAMSTASAGHCLEAWIGVLTVLKEKGWYNGPGDVAAAAEKVRSTSK